MQSGKFLRPGHNKKISLSHLSIRKKTEQGIKQRYEDDAEIVEQALPALLETLGISSVVTELYIGKNVTLFLPAAKLFIALFDMGALCKELNG